MNGDLMRQFEKARAALAAVRDMPRDTDEQVCARLLAFADGHEALAEVYAAAQADPDLDDTFVWRAVFDAESFNRAQARQFRESVRQVEEKRP